MHINTYIYISNDSRISDFTFTDTFSFFILCRKVNTDPNDPKNSGGRFIAGK